MPSIFIEDDPELATFGEDLDWPPSLDGNGDLKTIRGLTNLEAALQGRAITGRGEIPHRPAYGISFEEFMGAPAIDEEFSVYQARLLEQYQREDRIESVTVELLADTPDNGDVIGRVRATAKTGVIVGPDISLRSQ